MSAFHDLGVWRWIVGNWILFKMSFGWVIYHKVWESYSWSKLSWLFIQNPNLATFQSWWILSNPWWIMINHWSNDEISFKMRMLTKKTWSLTVCRSQLTFALAQLIFGPLSNWLSKLPLQGLKLDMDDLENILGHWLEFGIPLTQVSWCNMKP